MLGSQSTTGLTLFRCKPIWKRPNRLPHYGLPGRLQRPCLRVFMWMQQLSGRLINIVSRSSPASAFASSSCGDEGCPNFSYLKLLIIACHGRTVQGSTLVTEGGDVDALLGKANSAGSAPALAATTTRSYAGQGKEWHWKRFFAPEWINPVSSPKPRGIPPGWPKGKERKRRERFPVVKKGRPSGSRLWRFLQLETRLLRFK